MANLPDFLLDKQRQRVQFRCLAASLSSDGQRQDAAKLKEGLWGSLPESILRIILMRLPLATQGRLRCVCKKWNRLLLLLSKAAQRHSRPTCTFRSGGPWSYDCFFCPEESKWFRLPFQPRQDVDESYCLMATDGGLLCFMSIDKSRWELLICNPITGAYVRIIPEYADRRLNFLELEDFIVNLETKTFKLVFRSLVGPVMFDSKTLEWKRFRSGVQAVPDLPEQPSPFPGFVWKGKLYKELMSRDYVAFDLESATWSAPQDLGFPKVDDPERPHSRFDLRSWKDQVVLVQLLPMQEDPVRIWMLRDGPDASVWNWEKVPIIIPDKMKTSVAALELCLSHGHEYICFTTIGTHHWVKYTFATKQWRVMPRPHNRDADHNDFVEILEWDNFEPQTFMNPEAENHSIRFDGSRLLPPPDVPGRHFGFDVNFEDDYTDNSDDEGSHSDDSDTE